MRWVAKATASLAVTAAAALTLAGCGSSGGSSAASGGGDDKKLTAYVSGDVNIKNLWEKTLIPGFEKANPGYDVKLVFSEHGVNDTTTLARLGASVKAKTDPGMDIIEAQQLVQTAAQTGMLAPVSTSELPNLAKVDPALLKPVNSRAAPYRGSSVILGYNSEKVPEPPKTFADLLGWIKAHPGKFTYNSPNTGGSGQAFVVTALDQHVPAGDREKMVNGYDQSLEKDWDQGLTELKSLDSAIYQNVYPNGNQNVLNLLGKGQIWMAPVWSDQALTAKEQGLLPPEVKLTQISDPSFTGSAVYLGVPVNSKHKDAAFAFMDWMLDPAQQVTVVNELAGYPGIELQNLPKDLRKQFADLETSHFRPSYSTKMLSDMNRLWQQKVAG